MSDGQYDADFTVIRKVEGRVLLMRNALLSLYVLVAVLYILAFTVLVPIIQLIAILPLLLLILIFFTWRYVHVEYESSIRGDRIDFSRVLMKNNKKKLLLSLTISQVRRIVPLLPIEETLKTLASHTMDLRGGGDPPDAYCMLYDDERGRTCAVLFRATRRMLRLFLLHNPEGTVESDNLIY